MSERNPWPERELMATAELTDLTNALHASINPPQYTPSLPLTRTYQRHTHTRTYTCLDTYDTVLTIRRVWY